MTTGATDDLDIALLPGEVLPAAPPTEAAAGQVTDAVINERYRLGELRMVTEQARYPLPTIPTLLEGGNYILNPEFQRRRRWDVAKKSRLIESLIMNVPVPPIFLYEVRYSVFEVMDGLQRLSAIWDFYRDRFALTGLAEWSELNGRTYATLPEDVRRGVDRRYLSSIVLLQETTRDPVEQSRLKRLVFERINSGGVKLSDQETRNALFPGPLNTLCLDLARNPAFCRLWDIPAPDEAEIRSSKYLCSLLNRNPEDPLPAWEPSANLLANPLFQEMEDAALVLRFFAYRHILGRRGRSRTTFWDEFLQGANGFGTEVLHEYASMFTATVQLVHELFGDSAFYLYRQRSTRGGGSEWTWVERQTIVVYEPLMLAVSQLLGRADDLRKHAADVASGREQLYREHEADFDGRKVNDQDIRNRNQAFARYLKAFLA